MSFTPWNFALAVVGLLVVGAGSFGLYLYWSAKKEFGEIPSGQRLARIEKSPQWDKLAGEFRNQRHRDFQGEMNMAEILKKQFFGNEIRFPTQPLPSVKPNVSEFLAPLVPGEKMRAIWLGHSTVLLRIENKTILIDPTLTERVAPVFFIANRFQKPELSLEELPPVDLVLISHDHYDHLDRGSIQFFNRDDRKDTKFVAPLGLGAHLENFGVSPDRIEELDWWEIAKVEGVKITMTPSQHFSGRGLGDRLKTLWAGYALEFGGYKVFYSGDTGYHSHFKEIGERLGPFDVAFMESGQYNQLWHYVHLLPEEVVQATVDVKARLFVPLHWGMYVLSLHNWFDPIDEVTRIAEEKMVGIATPILGEIVTFSAPHTDRPESRHQSSRGLWWREHADYKSMHAK